MHRNILQQFKKYVQLIDLISCAIMVALHVIDFAMANYASFKMVELL